MLLGNKIRLFVQIVSFTCLLGGGAVHTLYAAPTLSPSSTATVTSTTPPNSAVFCTPVLAYLITGAKTQPTSSISPQVTSTVAASTSSSTLVVPTVDQVIANGLVDLTVLNLSPQGDLCTKEPITIENSRKLEIEQKVQVEIVYFKTSANSDCTLKYQVAAANYESLTEQLSTFTGCVQDKVEGLGSAFEGIAFLG